MKNVKSNKVLIWALAIAGVGLATYVVISLTKKPTATNNKLFSAEDISAVGSAIAGLFKKSSTTDISPQTGYPASAGINWFDQTLGPDFNDPNAQFVETPER